MTNTALMTLAQLSTSIEDCVKVFYLDSDLANVTINFLTKTWSGVPQVNFAWHENVSNVESISITAVGPKFTVANMTFKYTV